MQERIITLSTPVFFALILLELVWGLLRGRNTYRLADALTSIGLGALSQVAGVFMQVLRIGIYAWLFGHLTLAPAWPADAWWALPAALVFYDFCYYWHHRWMHEIALGWAAHVVHHSSEDYNLSTALRQTATGPVLGWIPYVPMALAGVPPSLFAVVALIDLLYQFWIHTAQIGRLGWFDRVFASPSNHRVHHAVNDRYLDRNYGGILIVWDRLFGTFADERADDPPVYGTRVPLRSYDPLRANLEVYVALLRASRRAPRWRDRLAVWVRRPGWTPAADGAGRPAAHGAALPAAPVAGAPAAAAAHRTRFDPAVPRLVAAVASLQFALALAAAVHFLQVQAHASTGELLAYFAWIAAALVAVGGLFEGRRSVVALEWIRHAATLAFVVGAGRWFGHDALAPAWQWALCAASAGSALATWLSARALDAAPAPGGRASPG